MLFLKEGDTPTVIVGPFISNNDGETALDALTIAYTSISVMKNGGAYSQPANLDIAPGDNQYYGLYQMELSAGNLDTPGRIEIHLAHNDSLPVYHQFMVLPANAYDSLVGGTDVLQADIIQISGAANVPPTVAQLQSEINDVQTDIAALNDFDPTSDPVADVTLVATTTTNTDLVDVSALADLLKFLEADIFIDSTTTPWEVVYIEKGTGIVGAGTELLRKKMKEIDGSNITESTKVVGQHVHTAL